MSVLLFVDGALPNWGDYIIGDTNVEKGLSDDAVVGLAGAEEPATLEAKAVGLVETLVAFENGDPG
jgi:hypothetical protein